MNDSRDEGLVSDTQLDRLVDGELDDQQYPMVLAALDASADGWRRCALAFLEHQAWRRELGAAFEANLQPQPMARCSARPRRRIGGRFAAGLALAASLAVAFFLGSQWAVHWPAGSVVRTTVDTATPQQVPRVDRPSEVPPSETPLAVAEQRPTAEPTNDVDRREPLENLTLLVDRDGESAHTIQLPVYESDDLYARWYVDHVPPIPVDVRRALERLGLEVRRNRHWAPVHAGGQRQVMVPIDQVEIVPVKFVP